MTGTKASAFSNALAELSALIRREYVSPELAAALADAVDDWNKTDRFCASTGEAFAAAVTEGLREIARDKHLIVTFAPNERVPQPPPTNAPRPKTPAHCPSERLGPLQAMKFGIRHVEIGDTIGIIVCDFFPPPFAETRSAFDAAMDQVKATRGLVLDLTSNRGGHPEMTAYALSYFFDRAEFPITVFKGRNWPGDSTRTTRRLGGPNYGERRPVAVAISANTFSGGEEVAYALQATKRAVIVGETSRGGANIGMNYPLPGGFRAFIAIGAPINAVTGTNWEGVGVVPDREAPSHEAPAAALDEVQRQLSHS